MLLGLSSFAKSPVDATNAVEPEKTKSVEFKAELPPAGLVPSVVLQLGQGNVFSQYAFIADKKRRTLTIWQMENNSLKFVEAHPIDYGKREGNKQVSGDYKTQKVFIFSKNNFPDQSLTLMNMALLLSLSTTLTTLII